MSRSDGLVERSVGEITYRIDPREGMGVYLPSSLSPPAFASPADFANFARSGHRLPAIVQWELLSICNFACPFCYIVGHTPASQVSRERALELADEFVEAGVVWAILTGGEPLACKHFSEVYKRLKANGLLVTVFSNFALADDEMFALFEEYPPASIEVSLYGFDETSYEQATGKRAWRRVKTNVERAVEAGLNVVGKSPITTLTKESVQPISQWCDELGIPYFASANVDDGYDGADLSEFSIGREGVVQFRGDQLVTIVESLDEIPSNRNVDEVFSCGVGKAGAYIDYGGNLEACGALHSGFSYELEECGLPDAWSELVRDVMAVEGSRIRGCAADCRARPICAMCPAKAVRSDDGELWVDPSYCEQTISAYDHMQHVLAGRSSLPLLESAI